MNGSLKLLGGKGMQKMLPIVEELIECISRKGVYDQFSKMSEKFLNISQFGPGDRSRINARSKHL